MSRKKADAYFASRALSKSAIDLLLECPALYKAWLDDCDNEIETKALEFGSMFHTLCLEPKEFDKRYAVTDLNLSTTAGREFKATCPKTSRSSRSLIMKSLAPGSGGE